MNILFKVFILHHYVKLFCKIKHYLMIACSISSYVKINENDFMPYTFFHYIISKMIIGIPQLLFIHALEYLRGRIMLRKSYNVLFLEWYITAWQYHICLFIVFHLIMPSNDVGGNQNLMKRRIYFYFLFTTWQQ